jgi:hypothetical protein
MTRVLSELLAAPEPMFRLSLTRLERSAGQPNADIRLSTEILHGMQSKLKELGLDPHDTRGEELYAMLGAHLEMSEKLFVETIRGKSTKNKDIVAQVIKALEKEISPRTCFALKNAAAKRLLKANMPKKVMKVLGYRSADSMLKHESAASLYAAATLIESDLWTKKIVKCYDKLKVTDFEIRPITFEHPTLKRWQKLSESVVAARKHNILSFKELGSVVLLPLPEKQPDLIALTTAVLTLHAVNEIRAASTFLKLHQVRPQFGTVVRKVVLGETYLPSTLLDQPISWNTVQSYYARLSDSIRAELFEPVLQAEDFTWHAIEQVLARIEPSLKLWEGTAYLGMLDDSKAISCNLTDLILSHCNRLPFADRQLQYFRSNLTSELTLRYLDSDRLHEAITGQFTKHLATEPVAA